MNKFASEHANGSVSTTVAYENVAAAKLYATVGGFGLIDQQEPDRTLGGEQPEWGGGAGRSENRDATDSPGRDGETLASLRYLPDAERAWSQLESLL